MSDEKPARPKRVMGTADAVSEAVAEVLPPPEQLTALPAPFRRERQLAGDRFLNAFHADLASIGASQTALTSDMTAIALEINGLARSNLTAAGDSVLALFGARNLVDAVEIQLGFARRSLDAFVASSTKLGEIGLRLASEVAKPMTGRYSAG